MLVHQTQDKSDQQEEIPRIRYIPPSHIAIDGQNRAQLVRVIRCLVETIPLYIQYIIHENKRLLRPAVYINLYLAFKRRRTHRTRITLQNKILQLYFKRQRVERHLVPIQADGYLIALLSLSQVQNPLLAKEVRTKRSCQNHDKGRMQYQYTPFPLAYQLFPPCNHNEIHHHQELPQKKQRRMVHPSLGRRRPRLFLYPSSRRQTNGIYQHQHKGCPIRRK